MDKELVPVAQKGATKSSDNDPDDGQLLEKILGQPCSEKVEYQANYKIQSKILETVNLPSIKRMGV